LADRYFKTQGIVLRTYKLGEADKIAVIYTRDYGKLRAVVKGIRKPTSKFGAIVEPGALIDFYLYRTSGDLQKVIQAVSLDRFKDIKTDLDKLNETFAILETVDKGCEDQSSSEEIFNMLHNVLKWLDGCDKNVRLVFPSFCFKFLEAEGTGLIVDQCVFCNQNKELAAFEVREYGFSCGSCKKSRKISQTTISAVKQVLNGSLRSLLESDSNLDTKEFETLALEAMEFHLGAQIKSFKKSATLL
jgi:DNA repair protein RecO (recombination protein O)